MVLMKQSVNRAVVRDNDTGQDVVLSEEITVVEGEEGEILETRTRRSFLADGIGVENVKSVGPACGSCGKRLSAKGVKRCHRCDLVLCRADRHEINKKIYCRRCSVWARLGRAVNWLFSTVGSSGSDKP